MPAMAICLVRQGLVSTRPLFENCKMKITCRKTTSDPNPEGVNLSVLG